MSDPYHGVSDNANEPGIIGENTAGQNSVGVRGVVQEAGWGVLGESNTGTGVVGLSQTSFAIFAKSTDAAGLLAESNNGRGVEGHSSKDIGVAGFSSDSHGVYGHSSNDIGVLGEAPRGVVGITDGGHGTEGISTAAGIGVFAKSASGEGIHAETNAPTVAAIAGFNLNPNGTGAAVYAKKQGSIGHAGYFDGNVHVTRSVTVEGDVMLRNADCAEEFTVANPELAKPGTVMVIGDGGVAIPCTGPYDHCVIGVVSGAGDFRPALLLDQQGGPARRPIALMGKVLCQVDADRGAIQPGDLLTTSSTPGHAMRASDATRAHGAVIGKALAELDAGRGMIPILAILQ